MPFFFKTHLQLAKSEPIPKKKVRFADPLDSNEDDDEDGKEDECDSRSAQPSKASCEANGGPNKPMRSALRKRKPQKFPEADMKVNHIQNPMARYAIARLEASRSSFHPSFPQCNQLIPVTEKEFWGIPEEEELPYKLEYWDITSNFASKNSHNELIGTSHGEVHELRDEAYEMFNNRGLLALEKRIKGRMPIPHTLQSAYYSHFDQQRSQMERRDLPQRPAPVTVRPLRHEVKRNVTVADASNPRSRPRGPWYSR